jgi:hypothetical protein
VVEGQDIAKVAGVGYPHTSHCLGSGDVMISTMGAPDGKVTTGSARQAGRRHAVVCTLVFACTALAVAAAVAGCNSNLNPHVGWAAVLGHQPALVSKHVSKRARWLAACCAGQK